MKIEHGRVGLASSSCSILSGSSLVALVTVLTPSIVSILAAVVIVVASIRLRIVVVSVARS